MKALRALRTLTTFPTKPRLQNPTFLYRLYTAQPQPTLVNETESDSVFDSSHYSTPSLDEAHNAEKKEPTWDERFRERADKVVFGKDTQKAKVRIFQEDEDERKNRALARALLEAALVKEEEEDEEVKEEDQRSLSVGIIGAPNAGKSAITNFMVCSVFDFDFFF